MFRFTKPLLITFNICILLRSKGPILAPQWCNSLKLLHVTMLTEYLEKKDFIHFYMWFLIQYIYNMWPCDMNGMKIRLSSSSSTGSIA